MSAKEIKDSGFSNVAETEKGRLLNKDGTSNYKKLGLGFFQGFSAYHWLISMKAWQFFVFIFAAYGAINVIFASLYILVGIDQLVDSSIIEIDNYFLRAFFFSTQTLTTLGYGQMSPVGIGANAVASLEAFVGLLMFALLTGLLYGRFSKPKAKLIFSKNALIAPYKEGMKGLMVRLANTKRSTITNVKARVVVSYVITKNEEKVRKYFNLPLEMDKISLLTTSWTLVHPLDDESPITALKKEELELSAVELIIQIEGFDETYNQQVSSRTSYVFGEIVFNAKFKKILHHDEDGIPFINLGELSEFELVG